MINISYDKRFLTEECFPLSQQVTFNVKGLTENIQKVQIEI